MCLVTTGLPHDIMHDLYEGVVKLELTLFLTLFLTYCTNEKYFTIEDLNRRICYYDNKPSLIVIKPHEYKIRQSASQMINLSKELPLLIGDKIPINDRY